VAEQDQVAVVRRQGLDRLVESSLQLPESKHLVGIGLRARYGGLDARIGCIVGGRVDRAGPRLLLAALVDRAVGGDAVQPGGETVTRVEARHRGVDLDEHLLGEVVGSIALSGDSVEVVDQRALMTPHELLERLAVAR
jgi:hypothetical protein